MEARLLRITVAPPEARLRRCVEPPKRILYTQCVENFHNPLRQPARPMPKRIAAVGAGAIGPAIGYYLKNALPALDLVLVDVRQEALDRAVGRFGEYAGKAVGRSKMTEAQAAAVTRAVHATTDYAEIRGADWLLEGATEVGNAAFGRSACTAAAREGIGAFLEHGSRTTRAPSEEAT
ncbi:MAG: hypothetical protein IT515_08865 [Burkholderiales bacterium]|nr:hypothetical protein [Burkholderiales bacterium]